MVTSSRQLILDLFPCVPPHSFDCQTADSLVVLKWLPIKQSAHLVGPHTSSYATPISGRKFHPLPSCSTMVHSKSLFSYRTMVLWTYPWHGRSSVATTCHHSCQLEPEPCRHSVDHVTVYVPFPAHYREPDERNPKVPRSLTQVGSKKHFYCYHGDRQGAVVARLRD